MIYNTALFEQAGITKVPTTKEELAEDVQKLEMPVYPYLFQKLIWTGIS